MIPWDDPLTHTLPGNLGKKINITNVIILNQNPNVNKAMHEFSSLIQNFP